MNPFSASLFSPSSQTAWPCPPLGSLRSPGTPRPCGVRAPPFLPPLPSALRVHSPDVSGAMMKAQSRKVWGLLSSCGQSVRLGSPVTTKEKFRFQQGVGLLFPLLGFCLCRLQGILAALASHSASPLLSLPPSSPPLLALLFDSFISFSRRPWLLPGLRSSRPVGALKGY